MGIWLLVPMVFFSVLSLLLGVKLARVEGITFEKALKATIFGGIASILAEFLFGSMPYVGTVLGVAVGYFASVYLTAGIFETTLGKALVAEFVHLLAFGVCFWATLSILFQGSAVAPFMGTIF